LALCVGSRSSLDPSGICLNFVIVYFPIVWFLHLRGLLCSCWSAYYSWCTAHARGAGLSVCVFVWLLVRLVACLFVLLFVCLFLCLFVLLACFFVGFAVCLFVGWFVCPSVCFVARLRVCLFVCVFVRSFVCLFACLPVLFASRLFPRPLPRRPPLPIL
jgi:hypothetical protein